MSAITVHSDFGAQENKVCHCFHCFPIYLLWSDGTGCHDLSFFVSWVLNQVFHSPLSTSSRGSLVHLCFLPLGWCHLYLRLLIFLPATLIPSCASSSPAFCMMYSAYKLKSRVTTYSLDVPVCCSMFSSNCCFLTCIQSSQGAGQVVWSISWRIFHSLLWST